MPIYQRSPDDAGHAIAAAMAFGHAAWLPHTIPQLLVRYVEVAGSTPAQWVGGCFGPDIYSVQEGPESRRISSAS